LIPSFALIGRPSGIEPSSSVSAGSIASHFVPAPRNAWRLTMFPKT